MKAALIVYLSVLLVLAFLPLTGYYAAAAALPVIGVYLYRRLVLEQQQTGALITRGIFLFAAVVFLCGFVLNLFCTLYTTYRMSGFRNEIETDKKRIYKSLKGEEAP